MTRLSYEEYLRKYHTLTYKNVGVSMLPLLKQRRDSFTVREVKKGESCKLWDVVFDIKEAQTNMCFTELSRYMKIPMISLAITALG